MEPFAPPAVDARGRPGIDLLRAGSEGFAAVYLNWQLVALYLLAMSVASVLAAMTRPFSMTVWLPVVIWANHQFSLDLVDGRANLTRLSSKLRKFDVVFGAAWGTILHYVALSVPGAVAIGTICLATRDRWSALGVQDDRLPQTALFFCLSGGYCLFLVRFGFALFLLVDRPMKVTEAFRISWRSTANSVLPLAATELGYQVLNLPAVAGFLALTSNPADDLGTQLAWAFGLGVLREAPLLASNIALAAAYRQLVPATEG